MRIKAQGPVKRLYTIPEGAYYLGRTVYALRELLWAGRLPYVKDGKRIYVDVADMDGYIDRSKTVEELRQARRKKALKKLEALNEADGTP